MHAFGSTSRRRFLQLAASGATAAACVGPARAQTVSTAELMAVVMARQVREGEVIITGTNSAIPRTAIFVAQRTGRPMVRAAIGSLSTSTPSQSKMMRSKPTTTIREG